MSKGDKSRITDKKAFDEGFDRIFKEKKNPKEPYINEYGDNKVLVIDDNGDKYEPLEEETKWALHYTCATKSRKPRKAQSPLSY